MRPLFSDKATRKKAFRRIGLWASVLLLFLILRQIHLRVSQNAGGWSAVSFSSPLYAAAALLLLPVSLSVEAYKWRLLLRMSGAAFVSWKQALISVLCGAAAAAVTPNRTGDFPARLLALKTVSVADGAVAGVLGASAQLATLFVWALPAVMLADVQQDFISPTAAAALTALMAVATLLFYFFSHRLAKWALHVPLLRRLPLTDVPISLGARCIILSLSLLRFAIYTTQFWLLLHWVSVPMLPAQGWMRCALFFSLLAVIPNFALAEIGIRGALALFLFHVPEKDSAAVFLATLVLWLTNLALPALTGAGFWFRRVKLSGPPTVSPERL